ncbi:MAG: hypothetical protein JWM93_4013, partial [Frankiales bacterium]|nr:hypothetical protein [Frankiales bacterium]
DSLGHVLGDEALRTIADRLRSAIGAADTVARDSGDGFLILIEDLPFADTAIKTAERIRESLRAQLLVGTHRLSVTATVGVAIADGRDAEALIGAADSAVSLGKERGGDQVSLFDEKVHSATLAEWALAGDLEGAVERDEISLHFQPVVNLMSGRAVGAEALMRWRHPVRGNVPPDAFIPVAERSKLIIELGGFALRGACAAAAAWLASGAVPAGFVMAVNLSARELADVDLFDRVSVILSDTGLPPESLCLEVTETAVMTDAAVAYRTLKRLNDAGVHLSIDDFGTGYSSLVYLKRLPVQQLKVDRMFVAGLGTDPDDTAIVASVIGLADAVGISCVAEGVETQEQAHALRRLGCRYAQGYLFGRPVPGDELLAALRSIDATAAAL